MSYFIEGKIKKWEVVLGLEVHAQISASSKLFSSASTAYGAEPNSQVNLVDAGMPGALPVINKECIKQAIITGLGLNAKINLRSIFDRKNYFYPDLPQGYQISQFEYPIVGNGFINIETEEGTKKIGITRLHLEQDAGKSLHDQDFDNSFIDLNRSGCALMEIVSEPDLRSPADASEYVKKLRSILRYVGSCDGNMEKGNMRADVNVSVREFGSELGTRCEIKNVNSIKFIQQAIEYEAKRQVEILESGGKIQQQTRLFDSQNCETRAMRSKEESHDYRYFPDPDLPPLLIDSQLVEELSKSLPELPDKKKERFIKEFGIKNYDAEILVTEKFIADFFEELIPNRDPKLVLSWLTGELFSYLNKRNLNIVNSGISVNKLGSLIDLIQNGTLSNRMAKEIFEEYLDNDKSAIDLVNEKGMTQVSDDKEIDLMIDKVLEENPKMLEQYNSGKEKLFGFFVGQVMKISDGKANPQMVNNLLSKKLK
ncbi:MAG: Asp-tRNA(Asn)/Glu-tRNA(Gln) amidotransferase GatCAB subunit B [Rickettsiales bacterium]|jgi:aspartyl-tRNA(Asn)/glutamyl-tRNA(Gln) amidotransferase subunit B|nr:Asp-tRNA(Asn)/Glu-tRNA(Gln) amidotransferase GatCAB subunit B [Rickettsiales bacterium]OUW70291.1 MAG: aspartyl/glutamyl-tRNA amidotransferase subunit B [Rickettsiales bacterium TMED211]